MSLIPHINKATPVNVTANVFKLQWPERSTVYQYDVITPQWESRTGREFKLGAAKANEVMMRLQTSVVPKIFSKLGVFDGKKNLFSWKKYDIPGSGMKVDVMWDVDSPKPRYVSVVLTLSGRVNIGILKNLNRGNTQSMVATAPALNMLNMSVQAYPRGSGMALNKAASFYIQEERETPQSIAPLELWRGYFQSVRLVKDHVVLNVDVTVAAVVPERRLDVLSAEFLGLREIRQLENLNETQFSRLRHFLRGMKVILLHRPTSRPKRIKGLVKNAGAITFDKDGSPITVSEHFRSAYNLNIRPGSLGVQFGQQTIIPISRCNATQQLYDNRLSPEAIREVLKVVPANPAARLRMIRQGWRHLGHTQSEFLAGAGININPEPLQVTGKALPRPQLAYGKGQNGVRVINDRHDGTWDIMKKPLHTPAQLNSWAVINFTGGDQPVIQKFSMDLADAMKVIGMFVSMPHVHHDANAQESIPSILYRVGFPIKAQLLVCVLPENAADLYVAVKRAGDVIHGIPTQCVRWSRKFREGYDTKKFNQYHNNLILKVNTKLAGRGFVPQDPAMQFFASAPTMIIGADVSHAAPGSMAPSIASVVASIDPYGAQYTARMEIQRSRQEIIEHLEPMVISCLEAFYMRNKGQAPQRLIFYRDGVSEGEFEIVRREEMGKSLDTAVRKFYQSKGVNQRPNLTFLVVTKRHHFRFFPNSGQGDKSANCHAGFFVDNDLKHPVYDDFYLQSQAGLKGTSIPGHYTILHDDIYKKLFQDRSHVVTAIAQLTYALCHVYSRSTRSVKIPAPVYYADLVCRRAKFHFDIPMLDAESAHPGEEHDLDFYRQHFTGINANMLNEMYFV
ncbi:Piwi-domain-containing protein [Guyanagaster necrorhizus]|uniref:Piwi-domain-containing protein n=1 Tax=Guyanagaster necrorhizus TaxID=856835 RepID=A0A9P7W601_9AGAR|nr:Piwi-domain-containing protein [Guyanagaster necrorhizus MCA 3950]KAG7452849.1 Piwi-domain-containing protein [Guyanagaster necrorhizus MCA 3950]